jgi:1-acyl-sn-glycerol-3-phosphate acyltransferase
MPAITPAGWLRVAWKGLSVLLVTFGTLLVFLLLRLPERAIHGQRRPWTPYLTQGVCRADMAIIGIRIEIIGTPMRGAGVVVSNHTTWLDIFALNAVQRVRFVAKSEVRGWPGIGWLARATGTLFIRRDRAEATQQQALIREKMSEGQALLFFPEGTSTDGFRVLPFKSTLFETVAGAKGVSVQAISVAWHAPEGAEPRFYGWWGDMDFAGHLAQVLALRRQGRVAIRYHPPVAAAAFADRKAMARHLEQVVRAGQPLAEGRSA